MDLIFPLRMGLQCILGALRHRKLHAFFSFVQKVAPFGCCTFPSLRSCTPQGLDHWEPCSFPVLSQTVWLPQSGWVLGNIYGGSGNVDTQGLRFSGQETLSHWYTPAQVCGKGEWIYACGLVWCPQVVPKSLFPVFGFVGREELSHSLDTSSLLQG